MASKPAPTKASSSLNDVASSAVQPSTLPPNISGAISSPELPSLRFCIGRVGLALRVPSKLSPGAGGPSRWIAQSGYLRLGEAGWLGSADQLPPTSGVG